ncbi:heterokaryon incompatibility protein-domain-containing protein [Annulohypoxylon bovei var. microspora]|nr:heterokaryon incompatibility protein-domain-containing protein [Annulohypoxylon bovei var. microspora]
MSNKVTYLWKLTTRSFSAPFRISGYRLSAGFWFRWTKDFVNPTARDEDDLVENRYEYDALPDGRYFRLLELHPGSGDEPLSGTLHTVPVESSHGRYDGLSYVWGNPMRAGAAKIDLGNGRNLRLTPNLTDALRQLRHKKRPRMMWVDAICINQWDDKEKSMQVPLMTEIYAHCGSVLVWLGLPTSNSRLGMEILAYLVNSRARIGQDRAPWEREEGADVEAALKDILERPYFERLWVVQEAALAPRVVLHVGRARLEWGRGAGTRRFLARIKMAELAPSWQQSALRTAVDLRPVRELLEQSLAAEARRTGVPEQTSLLDVVHSIRNRNVSDPRDRIYGVMSLVTPVEVAGLVPDYTLSWEETYRRFYDLVESRVLKDPETTLEDVKGAGG